MTAPLKNRDPLLASSAEPLARRPVGAPANHPLRLIHGPLREHSKKSLRVMKFGGTSVADASSIGKVADIVRAAVREGYVAVVVSAMSGVTSKLVEAAAQSEAGNRRGVAMVLEELRKRHVSAAKVLIHSIEKRQRVNRKMHELFKAVDDRCQDAALRCELTPHARDSIIGLGERLSILLVAAALTEQEIASEPIEATELIVTDARHGAAEPLMELTRERCAARLRPPLLGYCPSGDRLHRRNCGRRPHDSWTQQLGLFRAILGAALDADEVILWTDVDGILTADPRIVPNARPILEMSYREACTLAELGAQVLHPKTLHPLMQNGIPLSIRNTFAPDRPGTKITAAGPSNRTE